MNVARVFLFLALALCTRAANPLPPTDWIQPPVVAVSQEVNVSVGAQMAMVVGRYWFQYVRRLDDPTIKRISVYYSAFVPDDVKTSRDLLDVTQVKLMLGDREFRPETARLLSDEEAGPLPTLPHGTAVAWFIFQLPRELVELRFDAVISHFQPLYAYEGKPVAAYWPWLPNLDALRKELELFDKDYVITFDALPDATFKLAAPVAHLIKSSPKQLVIHATHREIIAVNVFPAAAATKP